MSFVNCRRSTPETSADTGALAAVPPASVGFPEDEGCCCCDLANMSAPPIPQSTQFEDKRPRKSNSTAPVSVVELRSPAVRNHGSSDSDHQNNDNDIDKDKHHNCRQPVSREHQLFCLEDVKTAHRKLSSERWVQTSSERPGGVEKQQLPTKRAVRETGFECTDALPSVTHVTQRKCLHNADVRRSCVRMKMRIGNNDLC